MDSSLPQPSSLDAESVRALQHNRLLATALLLLMIVIFVATHFLDGAGFWTNLVRIGSQAGIVGGLADWFAVTALFRHPLGIPIPHTAILPNNKDRIGRALGRFVEQSFLEPTVIIPWLQRQRPGRRIADWLSEPAKAAVVVGPLISFLPQLVRALENRELTAFLNRVLWDQLRAADVSPTVGRALRIMATTGEADILFERAADAIGRLLQQNKEQIDEMVRTRSHWWIPNRINRRIATEILEGVTDLLAELRDPNSDARSKVREALVGLSRDLVGSNHHRQQLNAMKNRLLEHPDVRSWLSSLWDQIARSILTDLGLPHSQTRAALEKAVTSLGRALSADAAMQQRINQLIEQAAQRITVSRHEIGNFITEVVEGWDAQTMTDRLELVIGNDLQYIRMNGTIVGALVGCLIFLVEWMLG